MDDQCSQLPLSVVHKELECVCFLVVAQEGNARLYSSWVRPKATSTVLQTD